MAINGHVVINPLITDEQLDDIYNAVMAVQKARGRKEEDAALTASDIRYAVFRGLFTYDSIIKSIVERAEKVFAH